MATFSNFHGSLLSCELSQMLTNVLTIPPPVCDLVFIDVPKDHCCLPKAALLHLVLGTLGVEYEW